jgi:CRISPR-associated protein Cas1
MIRRIVHVGTPSALRLKDERLWIEREGEAPGSVPVEDLGVLVLDYAHTTVTVPLLAKLAEQNVAVVVCDARHVPAAYCLALESNHLHAQVLREQIEAPLPRRKRLWQTIVQAKIRNQAALLRTAWGRDHGLAALAETVRSGDPENVEATAATAYFGRLFGEEFVRDRDLPGLNARLNYGYAVLRAAVARAVAGAGLHGALGIHHRSRYNAWALADDLVEPLRPLVDRSVLQLGPPGAEEQDVSPQVKRELLGVLTDEVGWRGKRLPLLVALGHYAANFRACLAGEERKFACPVL